MGTKAFYPSLYGRHVGLTDFGNRKRLYADGGMVSGERGRERRHGGPFTVELFDDFTGDVIADQWDYQEGTDGATAAGAILAGGIGGVLRLTTGDAGTGLAADMCQITQALQWQASNGGLAIEARFKISQITECYVFVGFTDTAASLEAPIVSAANADLITTTATDAVGIMFDTRMSTDKWWLVGVAGDTDATKENSAVAPVADTWETWRIEVSSTGVATFYRNGSPIGARMSGAVTAATDLTPTINVSKTATASSMTMDIDYIHVSMDR
jgi:hypothetical protein